MIEVFDNETENGKIYISYPMVEALKDIKRIDHCSRRCFVPAKKNIRYKRLVSKDTDFCHYKKFVLDDWNFILGHNIKKANCIITSSYTIPQYKDYRSKITQLTIFKYQNE